jgi:two-component system nitrate/nitrite response regulator NarL
MAYRILIVDDHAMIREVLCDFFKGDLDCESSLAVPDISSAIEYLRLSLVDIVLLDYDLGKELAFTFFDRLREHLLQVPVLIVSAGINHLAVRRLLAMGAAGVVWKTSALKDLADCVREVLRGATWKDSDALHRALQGTPSPLPSWAVPFSERQAQVLRGIAAGFANKEIAARLGVSETSVKCTVQQIFVKTGVRSRSELIRVMLERFPDHFVSQFTSAAAG